MNTDRVFNSGVLAGMLLMLAASGGHWLITPMRHPDATTLDRALVGVQVIVSFGVGLWLFWRHRRSRSGRRELTTLGD